MKCCLKLKLITFRNLAEITTVVNKLWDISSLHRSLLTLFVLLPKYHLVLKNKQTPLLKFTLTADYNKRIYLLMEIVIVSIGFSEKPFKSNYDSVTHNGGFKPHLPRNLGKVCSWYPKRLMLQNMREASSLNSQNSNPITPKI